MNVGRGLIRLSIALVQPSERRRSCARRGHLPLRLPFPRADRSVRRNHELVRSLDFGGRDNNRRRQCDSFRHPLNDFCRICRLSINHCAKGLNRGFQLFVGKLLDRVRMLELHLSRHQQGADFHVRGRLIFPHLGNSRSPTMPKVPEQRGNELGTEPRTLTRGLIRAAKEKGRRMAALSSCCFVCRSRLRP
jgi:hypothetical protein